MFGFGNKQSVMREYGLEGSSYETCKSVVDLSMKLKAHSCYIAYVTKSGEREIGEDFFHFLDMRAAFDHDAYFVKEVRKKLLENKSQSVEDLPELAIVQLNVLERVLLFSMGDGEANDSLKPMTARARSEIDGYTEIAARISQEAKRVREHQTVIQAEGRKRYDDAIKVARDIKQSIPPGPVMDGKLFVLQSVSQEEFNNIIRDSEDEFQDAETYAWLFSQSTCEIANVSALEEMWNVAEPCLSVTKEDDLRYIRSHLFPVYEAIADGLNTTRFLKNYLQFGKADFKILQSMVRSQEEQQAKSKTLLYPINPQILHHYERFVD